MAHFQLPGALGIQIQEARIRRAVGIERRQQLDVERRFIRPAGIEVQLRSRRRAIDEADLRTDRPEMLQRLLRAARRRRGIGVERIPCRPEVIDRRLAPRIVPSAADHDREVLRGIKGIFGIGAEVGGLRRVVLRHGPDIAVDVHEPLLPLIPVPRLEPGNEGVVPAEQRIGVHIPELTADIVVFLPDRLEDRMIDELVREVRNDLEELIRRELVVVRHPDPLQSIVPAPVTSLIARHAGEEGRRPGRALPAGLLPVEKQLLVRE